VIWDPRRAGAVRGARRGQLAPENVPSARSPAQPHLPSNKCLRVRQDSSSAVLGDETIAEFGGDPMQ
jgi:hypothetical protein